MVLSKLFLVVVGIAAIALPASAPPQSGNDAAQTVPDAVVRKAGAALVHVLEIEQAYSPQLDAADTPEAAKEVIDRIAGDATKAIRDQGLTPAEYKHVMAVAASDPGLRDRLLMAVKSGH